MSTEVHQAAETVTTSNELDLLFGPLFDEYLNGENQVVLKSSAVTTADASDKRQQQPDSTSSTSTLATSVTADGNFDLHIGWHLARNTRDLGSSWRRNGQIRPIHQEHVIVHSECGDGVALIKRRRQDFHGDGIRDSAMASGRGRLKVYLESSTW
ncbi:hypothetical protein Tco_1303280 [Tanacetum coccineum]